ncbi:MAG: OpgC domain-containing protein [Hyphomicrobiaceae bacterium]
MTHQALARPRPHNAVDFWRGFALVSIFINHIPGNAFERFTHRNFSPSDSAELFIFLAGWALYLATTGRRIQRPATKLIGDYGQRAFRIYGAHLLICAIALAILAFSASVLAAPQLQSWHNAAPLFANAQDAWNGLALLTNHMKYFDVLPLYVLLMLAAPALVLAHRAAPAALLPISLAIYLTALVFKIAVPQWPGPGNWTFNPLTWQFVFVLGFILANPTGLGGLVRRHIAIIRRIAWPIIIVGAIIMITDRWPNPERLPEPRLLFMTQKSFVTPIRVIDFLALAAVASAFFPWILKHAPRPADFLSKIGRNSLNVFCVSACLSLGGQILRYASHSNLVSGLLLDAALIAGGIAALGLTATLSETRQPQRLWTLASPWKRAT